MKNKCLIAVAFFLLSLSGLGQKNAKLVADAVTKQPIDYVYVSSDNKSIKLLSDKNGKIILIPDTTIRSFSFYKIGYQLRNMSTETLLKTDTIFLTQKMVELDAVEITARVIDTLVKNKRFYVDDYFVLPNNDFLLITSIINSTAFDVVYYKRGRGITCLKRIKNESSGSLFTDCFKNTHLLTGSYSRQIFFDSDTSFDFLPKYNRVRFDSTLADCVVKMDSAIIVKYSPPPVMVKGGFVQNPVFLSYLLVSKHQRGIFHTVYFSKEIMEMLGTEIVDGEMIVRNAKDLGARPPSEASIANGHQLFYNKVAGPIYAPIFLKNDTVVIFNFQQNAVVFLNKKGIILTQVAIDDKAYSSLRDFEIICDEPRQAFYIKTKKADKACLQPINIYTGVVGSEIKLQKMFAKKISIKNGSIYYLVKEKGWDDTSYLYQQN